MYPVPDSKQTKLTLMMYYGTKLTCLCLNGIHLKARAVLFLSATQ